MFVQNNTPFAFSVTVDQPGSTLGREQWTQTATSVTPGRREAVLRFNRDTGITAGRQFALTATVGKDGSALELRQLLEGRTVGSHMWHSLSGPGFSHGWYDDRETRQATWRVGDLSLRVLYRAFFTGTDDDVEYVLQHSYPSAPGDRLTFNVLAYNIYMRPTSLFKNGQAIRARLLPAQLVGYDVIVFSEAFDDDVRNDLLTGLRGEYPHATAILGRDRGVEQDGGVIVVSRWPITAQDQRLFGEVCAGYDCQSDKGVLYAKIAGPGRIYHIFGSHTQADPTPVAQDVRKRQFEIIKDFIDAKGIPTTETVIIAGDLNVDRIRYPDEFRQMLDILDAAHPPPHGHPYSFDPTTNQLAKQGTPSEFLDYVLWSKSHQRPAESVNEVRLLRAPEEWKEFGWERAMWDLSDHYAAYGRLGFSEDVGQFDMRFYSQQFLYGARPDGELLWYTHRVVVDRNPSQPSSVAAEVAGVPIQGEATGGAAARAAAAQRAARPGSRVQPDTPIAGEARRPGAGGAAGGVAVPLTPSGSPSSQTPPGPKPKVTHAVDGPRGVGTGWQQFREVIPGGGGSFFGVLPDGAIKWYRHDGYKEGTPQWKGPVDVGTGWNNFLKIVAAGDGIVYGIEPGGALRWYRHGDVADASASPNWSGPHVVGSGWAHFVHVFSTGEGVIYAVAPDGQLLWYRHNGYRRGTSEWEGPRTVGRSWAGYKRVFSPGGGAIYAVRPTGELSWHQHEGFRDGSNRWLEPTDVGSGWSDFVHVFPVMWGTPPAVH